MIQFIVVLEKKGVMVDILSPSNCGLDSEILSY
jgi:hypothetical protein